MKKFITGLALLASLTATASQNTEFKIIHQNCEISPSEHYFGVEGNTNKSGAFNEYNQEMKELFLKEIDSKGYRIGSEDKVGQLTMHGYTGNLFKCSGRKGPLGEPARCRSTWQYGTQFKITEVDEIIDHENFGRPVRIVSHGETIYIQDEDSFFFLDNSVEYLLDGIPKCEVSR